MTLAGTTLTLPDPDPSPSPHPELTLGLRAPPTLLSTSSGGKSTITHISSPGTLTRLGSVTHVTSLSHASPGNRGGCSFKVSPALTPPASLTICQPPEIASQGLRLGGPSALLTSCYTHRETEAQRQEVAAHGPQPVGECQQVSQQARQNLSLY